ncbi:MAG: Ig-like domain-containing protein, partial [Lysobacterales bacterium]
MTNTLGGIPWVQRAAVATVSAQSTELVTPVGQLGSWDLIFQDEFEGSSLDLSTWEPSWFGGNGISNPVNSDEDSCYDSAQVSVSGGSLKLLAERTTNPNCRTRNGDQAEFASGLVNTRNSFLFAYGYMESRIFLPGSDGALFNRPTFWTDGTGDWPSTGGIEVVGVLSGRLPCWHYHYLDASGVHQAPGGCVNFDEPEGDFLIGWHTYAAEWEPGRITYYYDGVEVGSVSDGVVDDEHFVILNHGINDRYGINVPATVEVDYVRVWRRGEPGTENNPPEAYNQSLTTDEYTEVAITLSGSDPDGDLLTYRVIEGPSHGILSGAAPNLTYIHTADASGTDSFTFLVNDGSL